MLAQLLTLTLCGLAATALPHAKTSARELAPRGLEHREVLRIGRDFGKSNYKVVVDAWVEDGSPDKLDEVRLWWVNTEANDERSPFGKKIRKYIGLDFATNSASDWTVTMTGDRKEFAFDVELLPSGAAALYADIETKDGRKIKHCRATKSTFVARRFLGLPIGIKRLDVQCVDKSGTRHEGVLPYRKVKRGAVYKA